MKKSRVACLDLIKEGRSSSQNKVVESNYSNHATELRKRRLESIVKRPNRSGSKVRIPWTDTH